MIDPHGSPIPDKNGKINSRAYQKLSGCKSGDVVKFSAITHSSDDFLRYLNSKDLSLGLTLTILSVEPFDGNMAVSYSPDHQEILSSIVCEKMLVEKMLAGKDR
jgi:DtxR family Mn-dependent transcriptional regulator